jgi:anthranilate phosphoribosyltransferase
MIKESIATLVAGHSLSMEEASLVMGEIMEGEATPAQLSAFLTALRVKGETAQEIAGMAVVMREKSLRVTVNGMTVDTAGTGGDGLGTFNISTASAFVGAASGIQMAKHGNRAASGACGSADVLEALGVRIDLPPDDVTKCIEEVGIGFMFAPIFHPAMRHAAPVRKEIGFRTVFNTLGPLTNPARSQAQVLGVSDPLLGVKMADVLNILGSSHSLVVHGEEGLDELTLGGITHIWEVKNGNVNSYMVSPNDVSLPTVTVDEIQGGTPLENADILRRVLGGEAGPMRDVVLMNGAGALVVGGKASDLKEGVTKATQAIDSGAALKKVDDLVNLSQRLGV